MRTGWLHARADAAPARPASAPSQRAGDAFSASDVTTPAVPPQRCHCSGLGARPHGATCKSRLIERMYACQARGSITAYMAPNSNFLVREIQAAKANY